MNPSRMQNVVVLLLLIVFLLISILSSPGVTVTLDEPLHYHYGLFVLQGKTDRIDDSSMPVSALNALPQYIASFLPDGLPRAILERYFVARLMTILFSTALAYLVFYWTRSLYGFAAAIFSTILYVLDPNIIANSQLVTTDIFATGMITLTLFLLWKFANSRSKHDGLMCACALGLSQCVKYTAVAMFPLGALALVMHDWPSIRERYHDEGIRGLGRHAGKLAIYLGITLLIATVAINLGFLFNRTLTPLKDYRFQTDTFRSLQSVSPALAQVPVPLPYPYLQGLDWMVHTEQTGDRYGNVYLLGHTRKSSGFPGYYFIASALKVPIAAQIIVLAAMGMYCFAGRGAARFFHDEVFLFLPIAAFTVYLNYFFKSQTGIRYYLVVFPLLYVLAGSLFTRWQTLPFAVRASSVLLIVYLAVSVLSYFPYFTPYFNEFVFDKTQTYKYLADSNLEWGQSAGDLSRYLSEHPDAVYDPISVQSGLLVVGGSDLVGILTNPDRYAWLRDNFDPVDTIAYSYFVYKISPQDIARLCISREYCK